jgi:hypothetical protein
MHQATIHNQRNTNRNIQRAKTIQQKDSWFITRWRKSIESKQEENEPENGVDRLNRKFRCCEQEGEERDMTCYSERAEGA